MKKKTKKKVIEQLAPPPPYTEGWWEEYMLEDNSYYDIDIINKANRPIFRNIEKWEKKYAEASSWLGKWYCQIQIDKYKAKLHHYK